MVYLFFAELDCLRDLRIFSSSDQGSWVLAVKTSSPNHLDGF